MGCFGKSVVAPDEIPAYLQSGINLKQFGSFFVQVFTSPTGAILTDSAKFDQDKPDSLNISHDTFENLKLRIGPLAAAILDPHKLYAGTIILLALMGVVYQTGKPELGYDTDDGIVYYDDVNQYAAVNDDADDYWKQQDVGYNAWKYHTSGINRNQLLWNGVFIFAAVALIATSGFVAYMMEMRNFRVDSFIKEICDEIRGKLEQEGYGMEYKSQTTIGGPIYGHFFPQRVLCFREISDTEKGGRTSNSGSYDPPSSSKKGRSKRKKESLFGTINVMVPVGYKPGQVVNVMTPSGLPIMVAVPNDVAPGESFPVQIPAQMYRPRK